MKIGEIGRGKSRPPQTWFSPGSYKLPGVKQATKGGLSPARFRLFLPDAKHPAWRLSAAVPERDRSVRSFGFNLLQAKAGTTLSRPTRKYPPLRVQGTQYPGGVWGKAPPFTFSNLPT